MSAVEIIALIRDIAIISAMLVTTIVLLLLGLTVMSIIGSVKRAADRVSEVTSTVSEVFAKPAASGSGMAFGAGKVAAFILGLRKKKGRKGGSNDG